MQNPAAWSVDPEVLAGAERPLVEIDRRGCVVDHDVRDHGIAVAVGDLDVGCALGHGEPL
ncbi:hypothetical protein ACWDFL_35785 [Streptomyces bungoensis]